MNNTENSKHFVRKRINTKQENSRRYYLHRKVRENGGVVSPKNRTCYIPHNQEIGKYMEALRKEFDYGIQVEIV